MNLEPGCLLGRYRVRARIGSGAMGQVYLAHDERLDRPVALKVLNAQTSSDLHRVEREARAASALNHPHILTVYDVDQQEDVAFISSEFIDGETLRARMNAGAFHVEETTKIVAAVASALAAAHAAGVVHRDIKPENIMLRADGWIKVLDFGIAAVDRHTDATMTADHRALVGTLGYIAPEQARGAATGPSSDVYSLGVVMYEMLTGQRPFRDQAVAPYILALVNEDARPPAEVRAGVPAHLSTLASRMLARDPAERPAAADVVSGLRGFDQTTSVSAGVSTAAHASSAAGAAAARRHSLPQPLTDIVGRDREVDSIIAMLERGDRLVTITGPGGVGKTRLAIEVARKVMPSFDDGVFFASLAGVRDLEVVSAAIADAMAGAPVEGSRRLLVLDNFEHVLEAAADIAHLLASHSTVAALVTSRAPLRVMGEREVPVAPLPLPAPSASLSLAELQRIPAIVLFVDRSRAAVPQFAVTTENADAIVEICRRLDGLPLAIELAAARVRLLPPRALLARLSKRLPLLTGTARDLPARHKTLRDAIAWSDQLLSPTDRKALADFSVFAGGFTVDAAEAVVGNSTVTLDSMEALAASSLLRRIELPDGGVRFQMMETIREYAMERLETIGDARVIRERHARFYMAFAATLSAERPDTESQWLDSFELDHDNLRVAFEWAIAQGDSESALSLSSSLWRYWEARSYVREGIEHIEAALQLPADDGLRRLRLRALYASGVLADAAGRYSLARDRFGETLEVGRGINDTWSIAGALNNLAVIALREGALDEARKLYEESLERWRQTDNRRAVALSLINLGNVLRRLGDPEPARRMYEESLAAFEGMADRHGVALASSGLGDVSRETGDSAAARAFFLRALQLHRALGEAREASGCLLDLACVLRDEGSELPSRQAFEEALAGFADLGDAGSIARTFEELARAARISGQPARAMRLAGAAAALRAAVGVPLAPDERIRLERDLHHSEPPLPVEASGWMAEGAAMNVERAIDYAISGS